MKRASLGPVLVLLAALATAGCTAGSGAAVATRTARAVASGLAAPARCPVTRPLPHVAPPAQIVPVASGVPLPVPYIHGWYGNAALWIGVPAHGILPAYPDSPSGGRWGTKFPWWRVMPGTLTITARRLDGPSAGFHGEVPAGYGDAGFTPSGLVWPAPGCWQVTGTVAGRSLTFVTVVTFVKQS